MIFYIPQRPYLSRGTLRQQSIYPVWYKGNARTKESLTHNLTQIFIRCRVLSPIIDRPDGWDAEQEWTDVLSGGLQQRIAMARLFLSRS